MIKKFRIFAAPFWARIPVFGVDVYPDQFVGKVRFWVSAIIYSVLYFYLIALMVVVFEQSLWAWSSVQTYLTAALFEIVYKNIWLVVLFVAAECVAIYREARTGRSSVPIWVRSSVVKWFAPATAVVFLYLAVKLITLEFGIEPNLWPVLGVYYVFFWIIFQVIDRINVKP